MCNWDKWLVLRFLLPASAQPVHSASSECLQSCSSRGCVSCLTYLSYLSYLISIKGFVFPQPMYLWPSLAPLENSDQDYYQQLYQTMQWCWASQQARQPARPLARLYKSPNMFGLVSFPGGGGEKQEPAETKTSRYLSQARDWLGKNLLW